MLIRFLILASLYMAGTVQANEVPSPLEQDLGKFRPLVIVARTDIDPTLIQFKKALEDPANRHGFNERNMVLYTIVGVTGTRDDKNLEPQSTMALLRGLKPGMIIDKAKVILVGKDGGKKLESAGDVDLQTLFKTIDALPAKEAQAQTVVAPEAASPAGKSASTGKKTKSSSPAKPLDD